MAQKENKEQFKINSINIIRFAIDDSMIEERRNSTEFLINLCLIEENNLEIENRIKILAILSNLRSFAKDLACHMNITIKLSNEFIKGNISESNILIRVFYRMGCILKDSNHLLHAYHFLKKSDDIAKNNQLQQDSKQLLDESFGLTSSQLVIDLELKEMFYLNQREEVNSHFTEIKKIIDRLRSESPLKENEKKVYLISSKWIKSLYKFILDYEESSNGDLNKFITKAFELKNVFKNYFREGSTEPDCGYPGDINNFDITRFEDYWNDPSINHEYENVFLQKYLEEYRDYYCINETEWNNIRKLFGMTNEIIRYKSSTNSNEIQIYLQELDIVIIESSIKAENPNLLKMRKIQFSNEITIKQFIMKIARCLGISQDNKQFHFYLVNIKEKEILTSLIIAYIMNCPKYQIGLNLLKFNLNDPISSMITSIDFSSFFIIIEVVHDESPPFIMTNINTCSKCSKNINSSSLYQCMNCYYVNNSIYFYIELLLQ